MRRTPSSLPLVLFALVVACGGDVVETDSRFATPERTVQTLLGAYGLDALSQEEIRARITVHGSFTLEDRPTFEACFRDLATPGGEGMAGYVVGLLAAARDDLRYETIEDRGYVIPREGIRVVMERGDDGAYRIVLRESVPDEVRRGLLQVEENAQHRVPQGP